MNILFVDTETTGTNAGKNTVFDVSCRLDVDGKTVGRMTWKFFNPNSETDLGALKVNKTRLSELVKMQTEDKMVVAIVDWLLEQQEKIKGPLYVSGQNVHFDINFLKALFARYSVTNIEALIGYKVLDTFGLALALVHVGKLQVEGGLSLASIAKGLNIDTSNMKLHTAEADVELTAQVLYGLLELMRK